MGRDKRTAPPPSSGRFGRRHKEPVDVAARKPREVDAELAKPKRRPAAEVVKPPPPPPDPGLEAKAALVRFWGTGPGSHDQAAEIATLLRGLKRDQVSMLGAFIPRGNPQTPIGERCERLRDIVRGVLAEG